MSGIRVPILHSQLNCQLASEFLSCITTQLPVLLAVVNAVRCSECVAGAAVESDTFLAWSRSRAAACLCAVAVRAAPAGGRPLVHCMLLARGTPLRRRIPRINHHRTHSNHIDAYEHQLLLKNVTRRARAWGARSHRRPCRPRSAPVSGTALSRAQNHRITGRDPQICRLDLRTEYRPRSSRLCCDPRAAAARRHARFHARETQPAGSALDCSSRVRSPHNLDQPGRPTWAQAAPLALRPSRAAGLGIAAQPQPPGAVCRRCAWGDRHQPPASSGDAWMRQVRGFEKRGGSVPQW